jgi:hypothetical protein
MPVALEQFVKQLTDSGVIAPGKLENFVPPKAQPKDAQQLAEQLVNSKCLAESKGTRPFFIDSRPLFLRRRTAIRTSSTRRAT